VIIKGTEEGIIRARCPTYIEEENDKCSPLCVGKCKKWREKRFYFSGLM
jgi:hypothetical protein